jgi:hypothetical protein
MALAYDSAGNALPGATFAWSSQGTGIATVTGTGHVIGVSPGTTTVTATYGGAQGVAVVNVSQGSFVTLEVVPPSATIPVGGTMNYSVIARDAAGQIRPSPAVTWISSASAIATINGAGQALGRTTGTTLIGAAAGATVAAPATLNVGTTMGPCDGIAGVAVMSARIGWRWTHNATNSSGHLIGGDHSAELVTVLTRTVDVGTAVWEGPPGGTAAVNDRDTNPNSTPVTTRTFRGTGPVASNASGVPLPGVQLYVDLSTCAYRFETSPWIEMTITEVDGRTETGTLPLGSLLATWRPLGDWRFLGISYFSALFPAHSLGWILSGNTNSDVYLPLGFGQLIFGGAPGSAEPAAGNADVSWAITIQP